MNFGERLKQARKHLSLTQKDFSTLIGVSQGSLSDLEKGKTTPSFETIAKVFNRLADISPQWLITGNGHMILGDKAVEKSFLEGNVNDHNFVEPHVQPLHNSELVPIELGTQISAGQPLIAEEDGHILLPKSLLNGYAPSSFCALPVNGDSMEPQILHGSIALIRYSTSWFEVNDKVAAVMVDGEITLKLVRADNELRRYLLIPFNPSHRHMAIDPKSSELRLVGILHLTIRYWENARYSQ